MKAMNKRIPRQFAYGPGERRAEKEIDTFLRSVNGPSGLDIMAALRNSSL